MLRPTRIRETKMKNEHYSLSGSKKCKELLKQYPDYKVFWRSGFAYRGASDKELDRNGTFKRFYPHNDTITFEELMERNYNWAAAIDIDVLHDSKELHFNGFSANDLY